MCCNYACDLSQESALANGYLIFLMGEARNKGSGPYSLIFIRLESLQST